MVQDGWKQVVICIVSDSRQKINSRTLSVIATIGVHQEGIATNVVNGKAVAAHIRVHHSRVRIRITISRKLALSAVSHPL
jgi:chitin synthase